MLADQNYHRGKVVIEQAYRSLALSSSFSSKSPTQQPDTKLRDPMPEQLRAHMETALPSSQSTIETGFFEELASGRNQEQSVQEFSVKKPSYKLPFERPSYETFKNICTSGCPDIVLVDRKYPNILDIILEEFASNVANPYDFFSISQEFYHFFLRSIQKIGINIFECLIPDKFHFDGKMHIISINDPMDDPMDYLSACCKIQESDQKRHLRMKYFFHIYDPGFSVDENIGPFDQFLSHLQQHLNNANGDLVLALQHAFPAAKMCLPSIHTRITRALSVLKETDLPEKHSKAMNIILQGLRNGDISPREIDEAGLIFEYEVHGCKASSLYYREGKFYTENDEEVEVTDDTFLLGIRNLSRDGTMGNKYYGDTNPYLTYRIQSMCNNLNDMKKPEYQRDIFDLMLDDEVHHALSGWAMYVHEQTETGINKRLCRMPTYKGLLQQVLFGHIPPIILIAMFNSEEQLRFRGVNHI